MLLHTWLNLTSCQYLAHYLAETWVEAMRELMEPGDLTGGKWKGMH